MDAKEILKSFILFVGGVSIFIIIANKLIIFSVYVSLGKPINVFAVNVFTILSVLVSIVPTLILAFVAVIKKMNLKIQNRLLGFSCLIAFLLLFAFYPIDKPQSHVSAEDVKITIHNDKDQR
jgi:hypothetical protein